MDLQCAQHERLVASQLDALKDEKYSAVYAVRRYRPLIKRASCWRFVTGQEVNVRMFVHDEIIARVVSHRGFPGT